MRKRIFCFFAFFALVFNASAATRDARMTNTTGYNYNYMYPYMNNQMRTNLNPGVTPTQNSNLIDTVVKTTPLSGARRVVPRTAKTTARSATASNTASAQNTRRVVARRGNLRGNQTQTVVSTPATNRSHPTTYTNRSATTQTASTTTERVSSTRCLSDYTECMNQYCERENTAYNRCYCSSKLSQIDSEYQPAIENLITQILTMRSTNTWTDAEMDEYWMSTVGKYTNENSWTNLDAALDINWADMESRVRGQNAYNAGHEYCVQHLQGCYYMAGNLRDAYRSEIARDCATYEQSLQRLKNAAESIVESYRE
ncbi:MAG: hypothetical protein IJW84_01580 [Alphaproteobacteria bacterium]|nr:hypothetical protein [Alphaproteobacteria bacterium]